MSGGGLSGGGGSSFDTKAGPSGVVQLGEFEGGGGGLAPARLTSNFSNL